eukprot:3013062-Prymnesium_polylepis.2
MFVGGLLKRLLACGLALALSCSPPCLSFASSLRGNRLHHAANGRLRASAYTTEAMKPQQARRRTQQGRHARRNPAGERKGGAPHRLGRWSVYKPSDGAPPRAVGTRLHRTSAGRAWTKRQCSGLSSMHKRASAPSGTAQNSSAPTCTPAHTKTSPDGGQRGAPREICCHQRQVLPHAAPGGRKERRRPVPCARAPSPPAVRPPSR